MNQDPIGLWGGENLYQFAANIQTWIDPLGWSTVYLRNGEVYVGKSKHNAQKRYGKTGVQLISIQALPLKKELKNLMGHS